MSRESYYWKEEIDKKGSILENLNSEKDVKETLFLIDIHTQMLGLVSVSTTDDGYSYVAFLKIQCIP